MATTDDSLSPPPGPSQETREPSPSPESVKRGTAFPTAAIDRLIAEYLEDPAGGDLIAMLKEKHPKKTVKAALLQEAMDKNVIKPHEHTNNTISVYVWFADKTAKIGRDLTMTMSSQEGNDIIFQQELVRLVRLPGKDVNVDIETVSEFKGSKPDLAPRDGTKAERLWDNVRAGIEVEVRVSLAEKKKEEKKKK